MLGNLVTGQDTVRAGQGTIRASQEVLMPLHSLNNFEIQGYY